MAIALPRLRSFLSGRAAAWMITLGAVLVAGLFASVEWTHPYCSNPSDGPGWAAFGFPLPYRAFGGVSSLEFDVMPHVLLFNIAVQSALAYPFADWLARRLSMLAWWSGYATAVASTAFFAASVALFVLFATAFYQPVAMLRTSPDGYWSHRPVAITHDVFRYPCTRMDSWFPNVAN